MTVQNELDVMRKELRQLDRQHLEQVADVHYGLDAGTCEGLTDEELIDRMVEMEYHAACV